MDAPVLVVVPPTPRTTLNTRRKEPSPVSNPSKPSDEKSRKSSSSLTSYDSQAGASNNLQGRTSSEKTAVNIYDLYSGTMDRDSYASSNKGPTTNGGASTESDTIRGSTRRSESRTPPATRPVYPENRYSIASSARESLRDSVYATPLQTPMDMATVPSQDAPLPSSNVNVNGRPSQGSENGYLLASPSQVVEHTGRNSPTIVIDPPPRRSSKVSLNSANHSIFDRSKDHPSTSSSPRASMSSAARPSLSPTRLSTDPATSATSSSAPSVPQHPLPSPLIPNAPSPGVNEDPDSYYVRATYAALDVTGVRGDGYEDGEELTRARLGNARGTLPSPIPNTAKRMEMGGKELNEKEKEVLGQLDRYGFYAPPSDNRLLLLPILPFKVALSKKVYTCLVRLHDDYDMHETFLPGFPGLLEAFYVQEKIMQKTLPGIYAVFKKNMISTTAYAVKWYITLFANTVSYQTQLRLWDAYFLEGKDVLVLMAVAILWAFKDNLLSPSASFESILSLLSSFYVVEDEDALMVWLHKAMSDTKLRRDLKTWRAEWKDLVKNEKEKDALL
ncbi:hypothetical protein CPB86DRAFT_834206 [Serendipita vermifera]|nr:hypothetical protein CPB86DRAFT_834206 [Serendipita vermifera]